MTGGHDPHPQHSSQSVYAATTAAAAAAAAEATPTEVATADEYAARLVRERGFEVHRMVGDGNCLFTAEQVYGDQEMHGVVRQQCCDMLVCVHGCVWGVMLLLLLVPDDGECRKRSEALCTCNK